MQGEKPPVLSLADAKSFPGYDQQYGNPLRMLMAMVGLVLLIALANVVMLLMARNAARQREFSVRQALGAGRGELLRQLLTESLILVTAGGALAWGFAEMATRLLGQWAQIESSLAPDRTVLLFTLGVLALAALAVWSGAVARGACRRSGAGAEDFGRNVEYRCGQIAHRQNHCALQMALCVVLLVGAGLLIRTLRNLENTPLGMKVDGLVVFGVKPNIQSIPKACAFYREPDEQAARLARRGIGDHHGGAPRLVVVRQQRHAVDGRLPDVANGASRTVRSNVVGPDFFHTLGVPVLAGRDFADSDTATSPHVGIINEQFAQRFLPNQNPLGPYHRTPTTGVITMTIVGVVKDHKYRSIDEEPIPMAWYMYAQIPMVGAMNVEMRVARRAAGDSALGTQGGAADGSQPAADSADDAARAIRHDHLRADAVCAAGRVLRLSGGGSGGDRPLRNAGLSREHADGGDRRAHGGGRAARAGGLDDPERQPAAHRGRGVDRAFHWRCWWDVR